MRVVQVVESLAIGGLERMAVDLAISLKSRGHDCFIYCVCAAGPLASIAAAAGVNVRNFGKEPGFSARTVCQILRQLRADRIDVVHTHNSVIHHYGAVARLIGIPILNTAHGLGVARLPDRQMRWFRMSIPLTEMVVFVSDEARSYLWDAGNFPPAKARVIRNGIPTGPLRAKPATPGEHLPRIRFGTVGRLVPVKDHATLLRAFSKMLDSHPGAELHVLGYGPLEAQLRALALELRLGERFRLFPPDSDVPSFLSGLDVFTISSLSEGLPISLLEAMAAGLPLVSTRVGGIPEAAPESEVAWYAPPGDITALAAALSAAASSKDLPVMGRRAAAIVEARFSIETMVNGYEELYRELIGDDSGQIASIAARI